VVFLAFFFLIKCYCIRIQTFKFSFKRSWICYNIIFCFYHECKKS